MVKTTFINLPQEKKTRIEQALLHEFSNYSLPKAQVARIVKEADIARGAFYKYFADLTDAYQYVYRCALKQIHAEVKFSEHYDPQLFYQSVVTFLEQTLCSKYAKMVKMHVLYNESLIKHPFSGKKLIKLSAQNWSAMMLSHAAIREILANPSLKSAILAQLQAGLLLLKKETK